MKFLALFIVYTCTAVALTFLGLYALMTFIGVWATLALYVAMAGLTYWLTMRMLRKAIAS